MESYKVSIVNYLNSAIFVEGLYGSVNTDIQLDIPADSAKKLLQGEVDVALAPVAIIPHLKQYQIISDYCIGTEGEVATVKLFSDVPIHEIESIYLDYHSRTSVQLIKVLCQYYWKISPELLPAYPSFQKDIFNKKAGLIIGDRAVLALGRYKYEYDLGYEWTNWQKLPFVFAVWLANKEVDKEWLKNFNNCLAKGMKMKDKIIKRYSHLNTDLFSVDTYLNQNISYNFNASKKQGLEKFLSYL